MTIKDYIRFLSTILFIAWIYFDTNSIPVTVALWLIFLSNDEILK